VNLALCLEKVENPWCRCDIKLVRSECFKAMNVYVFQLMAGKHFILGVQASTARRPRTHLGHSEHLRWNFLSERGRKATKVDAESEIPERKRGLKDPERSLLRVYVHLNLFHHFRVWNSPLHLCQTVKLHCVQDVSVAPSFTSAVSLACSQLKVAKMRPLVSTCLICPHVTTREPLDGFSRYLTLGRFTIICRLIPILVTVGQ
jgi:hypothetical protein